MSKKITSPEQALESVIACMTAAVMIGLLQMSTSPPESASDADRQKWSKDLFEKIENRNRGMAVELLQKLDEFYKGENETPKARAMGMYGAKIQPMQFADGKTNGVDFIVSKNFAELSKVIEQVKENIVRDIEGSRIDKVA